MEIAHILWGIPLGCAACFFAVMLMSLRGNPHSIDQPLARALMVLQARPRFSALQGAFYSKCLAFWHVFALIIGRATAALVFGFAHSVKTNCASWLNLARGSQDRLSRITPENILKRYTTAFKPGTQEPHPMLRASKPAALRFGIAGARCSAVKTSPPPLVALAKNSPLSLAFKSMIMFFFISRSLVDSERSVERVGGKGQPASYAKSSHKRPCQNHLTGLRCAPMDFGNAGLWKACSII